MKEGMKENDKAIHLTLQTTTDDAMTRSTVTITFVIQRNIHTIIGKEATATIDMKRTMIPNTIGDDKGKTDKKKAVTRDQEIKRGETTHHLSQSRQAIPTANMTAKRQTKRRRLIIETSEVIVLTKEENTTTDP
jgi:hypothetical protein